MEINRAPLAQVFLGALLLSISFLSNGQKPRMAKPTLTGNWLLVKHLITEGGKTTNELGADEHYTYSFAVNGTYSVIYSNSKTGNSTTYKGKWRMTAAGKTLKLYDNTLPSDPKQLVADNNLPVLKLTATEFVTRELLFAMDMKGTSYYKRQ